MARTLAEADTIARAAARSNRVFRVFENYRCYPPYIRAKELLEGGAIGEPLSLRVKVIGGNPEHGWKVPLRSWAWRLQEELSGGGPQICDHGYHIFSIALFFLGPVEEVFAWIERTEVAPGVIWDSPAVIAWRHREAPRFGTWESIVSPQMVVPSDYYPNDEWLELTGSRGLIWVNRCTGRMLPGPPVLLYRDGELRAIEDVETDWAASFREGTRRFIEAVRRGGQPPLSAAEGREVLRFSVAAHLSARQGRPVRLAELA